MKKYLLTVCLSLTVIFSNAQILDTVSTGAGYSQQVWYNLETDKETKSSIANWDIAFEAQYRRNAAIWVNPLATLYAAVATAADFANVKPADTAKLVTPQYNSDTSWFTGAFNRTGDGVFNYGWGNYNIVTHNVVGDSVYILKLANGQWRKILIERLARDTSFFFKYANLDGSNEKSFEFKKRLFNTKNFGYFSFATDNTVDREPNRNDWHLHFTRYWGQTPDDRGVLQSYSLQGILLNDSISAVKIKRDTADDNTAGLTFSTRLSVIGADWKSFDLAQNRWKLADSTAYFIKLKNGKIFKLIFTGFGGSSTGNYIFKREEIKAVTNIDRLTKATASLAIAPNPATDGNVNVVFDLGSNVQKADLQVFTAMGQVLYQQKLSPTEGVQYTTLPTLNLQRGVYFVQIQYNDKRLTQKLVIQ